ncbi:MAG: hypothetical protein C0472_10060 [Erythrobacter sp.]|nr:hypothetical protein [Erythrobacter sp.]
MFCEPASAGSSSVLFLHFASLRSGHLRLAPCARGPAGRTIASLAGKRWNRSRRDRKRERAPAATRPQGV